MSYSGYPNIQCLVRVCFFIVGRLPDEASWFREGCLALGLNPSVRAECHPLLPFPTAGHHVC